MSCRYLLPFLAACCLFLSPPEASAEEPLPLRPYRLRVVLHVARHPLLTEVFRLQLERALGDGIQAALGVLGRVEVVREHPALPAILDKGLLRALDGWTAEEDIKTHFVLISYAAGGYEVQTRQFDGFIGQASPVVRRSTTRDRAYVARTTALLMKRDFGVSGRILSGPGKDGLVQVQLRGGELGVSLASWVQQGEVFGIAPAGPSGRPAGLARWAVLVVKKPPEKGANATCACELFSRYDLGNIGGAHCIKLGTVTAPLNIQLVRRIPGTQSLQPLADTHLIQVRRHGFDEDPAAARGFTDSRDAFSTADRDEKGLFDHVAFVTIMKGSVRRARLPVPLLDDQVVVVPLSPSSRGDDPLRLLRESWIRAVSDAYLRQSIQFQNISSLATEGARRGEALSIARKALEQIRGDSAALQNTRQQLVAPGEKTPADLALADERLSRIRGGEQELVAFIDKLKKIEEEEKDPRRKEALAQIERARLLEKEGELGKAIAIYEAIPADLVGDSGKEKLASLRKIWTPKNDQHRKARDFIYNVWPTLDTTGLKERMDDAQRALDVCRSVGDLLGPRKLLDGTIAHGVRLEKELTDLKPSVNIQDEKPARLIEEVTPQLGKLASEINTYLQRATPTG